MTVNVSLKTYQRQSLDRLQDFLTATADSNAMTAFGQMTGAPYFDLTATMQSIIEEDDENFAQDTPYVCLRVPTGGGKTIMAAHAIGITARHFLQATNPMVLWLVPSTAILDQTLNALRDRSHPYCAALAADFGDDFIVMDKSEALSLTRPDAEGNAIVIVATIQSFRRRKPNGDKDEEGLKVYADAGALMSHFSGLDQQTKDRLVKIEDSDRPIASLQNVLRLHRPMVIVDEAHNASTSLSYKTLARFTPALILEFTATPQLTHDPDNEKYGSNILHAVSAAELKAEEMIKLPIQLTTDPDWRSAVTAAVGCRAALEQAARAEEGDTGEYIRPVMLLQAQSKRANDPDRVTFDRLRQCLIEDHDIPEEQIALHTGDHADLDDIDIADKECPVRFVITVAKLKEGWDCPFAYVLCSVAEQASGTAVEQILGRILRLPRVKLKQRDALNQAYAFVASSSFERTAQSLADTLVEGSGFSPVEARAIITPQVPLPLPDQNGERKYTSPPLTTQTIEHGEVTSYVARVDAVSRGRASFDGVAATISISGPMNKQLRNSLLLIFAPVARADVGINRLYAESNGHQIAAPDERPLFAVPNLGLWVGDNLIPFDQDHYFHIPWQLEECDPSPITREFQVRDRSSTGLVDVDDEGLPFALRVQKHLRNVIYEPPMTRDRLIKWLDMRIEHREVTKSSAHAFIENALTKLEEAGHDFKDLIEQKYELKRALARLVQNLRRERGLSNYGALFETKGNRFETSADIGLVFEEDRYSFNCPYDGLFRFQKHYFPIVGDLESQGEEFECACHLDQMDEVQFWVRNIDRKPNSFWLQMPNDRFYPDFVAKLTDGRTLVVEYKGAFLTSAIDARQKDQIGKIWAERSSGTCLFIMVSDRNFITINRMIA